MPSYREIVGDQDEDDGGEDGGDGIDDEEDERYLRSVDAFEAKYNFRWGGCAWGLGSGLSGLRGCRSVGLWDCGAVNDTCVALPLVAWAGGQQEPKQGRQGARGLRTRCLRTPGWVMMKPRPNPHRYEEPGADRIITHPRNVEGTVRKEDDRRKRQRDAKKARQEAAEAEAREEVKRMKNLKKQEIESK